ncbi:hypothetical protein F4805DRAFT_12192 [Annulohypoxylon moriforme]|nr:hypothetical protein F4805DRAFT_12192 [Annulohypoxylon moriforme]
MDSQPTVVVKWVGFSAVPLITPPELLISAIRQAVLDSIEDKVLDQLDSWLEARLLNTHWIELEVYPLPHETDFNMPDLATILPPSLKRAPILSELTTEGSGSSGTDLDLDATSPNLINDLNSSSTDIRTQPSSTAYRVVKKTYEHNKVPPKAPAGRKIGFLLDKPARNTLQYSRQFFAARKEFNGGRDSNVFAALLQTAGTRKSPNERCQACKEGRGPWDGCVVSSWGGKHEFSGACANCHYNSKANRCSFFKGHDTIMEEEINTQSPHHIFTVHAFCFTQYTRRRRTGDNNPITDYESLNEILRQRPTAFNVIKVLANRHFYIPLTTEELQSIVVETLKALSHKVDISVFLPSIQELMVTALGREAPA